MGEIVYKGCLVHPYNSKYNRTWNIYDRGDFAELELTQGKVTYIDTEDVESVKDIVWRFHKSRDNGYGVTGRNHLMFLHNYICQVGYSDITIDHKNRNGLDNRKLNLRLATKEQQMFNRDLPKNSGFHGVMLRKDRDLYRVYGRDKNSNRVNIGHFKDPIKAAEAWDEWMYEEFKRHNPLIGVEFNGVVGEPTLNFLQFNFPERLCL